MSKAPIEFILRHAVIYPLLNTLKRNAKRWAKTDDENKTKRKKSKP